VGDEDGEADGDDEGEVLGVEEGDPLVTPPVQVTPLRLKEAGAGFELLFHAPLNPKLVLAPVPREPLYEALVTVTFAPDCV
jgi:hypothetical protein